MVAYRLLRALDVAILEEFENLEMLALRCSGSLGNLPIEPPEAINPQVEVLEQPYKFLVTGELGEALVKLLPELRITDVIILSTRITCRTDQLLELWRVNCVGGKRNGEFLENDPKGEDLVDTREIDWSHHKTAPLVTLDQPSLL